MEINNSKISSAATNYEARIAELNREYNKILAAITALKGSWMGERGKNFFDATATFLPEFETAVKNLKDYYTLLSNVPKVYSALDKSYKNKKIGV